MPTSREYFTRAGRVMPGGVNSPVRAFKSVGLEPKFIARAQGPYLYDVEGKRYIDYVGSWGPMILGHDHPDVRGAVLRAAGEGLSFGAPCPGEVEMAETIVRLTGMEMVRMVSSGTEAVMTALRLARGFTGRDKVLKFEGCYHGHSDGMLVKAGSGALTGGIPSSAGIPAAVAADTLTARFNDLDSVRMLLAAHEGEVAAVIAEPVAANMGVVPPKEGFLSGLRALCDQYGALLILDEVITGFRLGLGGAQGRFGVRGDLAVYGKIIGGGMPVGAVAGSREIMELLAPVGPVYQAGTLSGNPVAMAAGLAQLRALEADNGLYDRLDAATARFAEELTAIVGGKGLPFTVNRVGSLCCPYFAQGPVDGYQAATGSDTGLYARFFACMLERGIYLAPSQFEAMFFSAAHTDRDIDETLSAAAESILVLAKERKE